MADTWRKVKDLLAGRMTAEQMMDRLERDLPHYHPQDRERVFEQTRNSVIVYFEVNHRREVPQAITQQFEQRKHDIQRYNLLDKAKQELAKSGGPMTRERFQEYLRRGKEYHANGHSVDGPARLDRLQNMLAQSAPAAKKERAQDRSQGVSMGM